MKIEAQLQTCLWVACYARGQPGSLEFHSVVVRVRAGAEACNLPLGLLLWYNHIYEEVNKGCTKKETWPPANGWQGILISLPACRQT